MTDGTGAVVWAADYKPFGEATVTVLTITNNLRFPGQYFDAETGLNYNYFRDYNPVLGRYVQADLVGLWGGLNLFVYVMNQPNNWIDPLGLDANLFGPSLVTDMTNGITVFSTSLLEAPLAIPTQNKVDSKYLKKHPGANDPFSNSDVPLIYSPESGYGRCVRLVPSTNAPDSYGPDGTYIKTGDPRGRDIHGGGQCGDKSGKKIDPAKDYQGWCVTFGCTRGQNKDVQALYKTIEKFLNNNPGVCISYERYK